MADETPTPDAAPKKLPLKMIIAVVLALVIEGGVVAGIFFLAGGPSEVKADGLAGDLAMTGEQPVEMLVVSDKFQNTRTGRAYLYDVEVWCIVRSKDQEKLEARKEGVQAAIKSDVTRIFRGAKPAHLHEQELSTLTRQIRAAINERFGYDSDGEPYVQDVFLAEFSEFRAD